MTSIDRIEDLKLSEEYHRKASVYEIKSAVGEVAAAGFMGGVALFGAALHSPGLFLMGTGFGVFAGKMGWEDAQAALEEAAIAREYQQEIAQLEQET